MVCDETTTVIQLVEAARNKVGATLHLTPFDQNGSPVRDLSKFIFNNSK